MRIGQLLLALACLAASACGGGGGSPPSAASKPTPTRGPTRPILAAASPRPSPSTSPVAAARPLVYVAIGASDTVGVGATDPAHEGWVPRLAQMLGPTTQLHNLGVSGTVLHTAVQDQLPAAVRAQPDLVTVWLAVNDLDARVPLEQYRADLDTLLATLTSQTRATVLLANVPDLTRVPMYKDVDSAALSAEIGQWNAAIADVAQKRHAVIVDLYAEYAELAAHPEDISGDGFHPSSLGYARVAELFYDTAHAVIRAAPG